MPSTSANHHRRSIRLKDYDYSQPGSYFVTICTHGYQNLFGDIVTVGAGSKPISAVQSSNQNFELTPIEDCAMDLNAYGKIVLYTWNDLINHNKNIKLGDFVIMPNHIHGIIHILDPDNEWNDFVPSNFMFHDVGAGSEPAPTRQLPTQHQESTNAYQSKQTSLSEIIRQFKTFSARRINQLRNTPGVPAWHRDYYEHIIRNQESYDQIVEYIQNNPMMWKLDKLYID